MLLCSAVHISAWQLCSGFNLQFLFAVCSCVACRHGSYLPDLAMRAKSLYGPAAKDADGDVQAVQKQEP